VEYIFMPNSGALGVVPNGEACTITSSCSCLSYMPCYWPSYWFCPTYVPCPTLV